MMTHKGTQTIETPRLLLRRARLEDAQSMFRNWASDPEVTKFLTWPPYRSADEALERVGIWMANYEKDNYYQWMIELKELGEAIGSISAVDMKESAASVEVGYCIGRAWWHQGLVTEAMEAVIDYFLDQVGMNRVEAQHDTGNPHSGGVMRKCGMQYEGTSRQSCRNNQGICDMAHYAILRSDRRG